MRLHPLHTDMAKPERFTWPFCYEPHPLCLLACDELKREIERISPTEGKMFGVLVVESEDGLGFLAAYSGLLEGRNDWEFFVPPVFDAQQPDGYFKQKEREISLASRLSSLTSYRKSLPFQQVKHYKAVWDNSINLPKGYLKAIVGYQQNRRQEFEESMDDYEVFFKLHTVTYDVRYLTQEFEGWKLAVGMNGMWQKSRNLGEEAFIPEYRLFDIGGYATVSKSWDCWTLNGGLRYDNRHLKYDHSKDFDGVTGSVGAVWNANEHFNVRMNVARGFRAPNMSELGSDGVHEGTVRYEMGNPNLKAEYSWQADLGVDFTSHYVEAQVALFANRISNYIFTKRVDVVKEEGYNTYQYTQGDARLLGFEAGVDIHHIHRLHFGNTFSYVDARQLNQPEETRYLPFTPTPRWTSEVKYEITHQGKILNNAYVALGLECYLRQNHYYKADQTETATPSYTLLNLAMGTDLVIRKKKVAELYVTADNLFNRAYQNHLSRLKYTDINVATGRMGVYNMGRNVVMKVVVPIEVRGVK